jgi:hypothetical protein
MSKEQITAFRTALKELVVKQVSEPKLHFPGSGTVTSLVDLLLEEDEETIKEMDKLCLNIWAKKNNWGL